MAFEADRPYFNYTIEQLEKLLRSRRSDPTVLASLGHELEHRKTKRAVILRLQVKEAAGKNATKAVKEGEPRRGSDSALPAAQTVVSSECRTTQPNQNKEKPPTRPMATMPAKIELGELPTTPLPENANEPQAILATWTALEALSPPMTYKNPVDLASGDRNCVAGLLEQSLPWQRGERSRPKYKLYYQIVLGAIHMGRAVEKLTKAFGEDEEIRSRSQEKAAIAVILVDRNGVPVEENSIAVSSFAWALPMALRRKLNNLGAWSGIERRIVEKLGDVLRRVDDDGEPLPLDFETIMVAHAWLVEQFGLADDLVEPPSFALRVYHYYRSRNPPEALLLNSFFLGDLAAASAMLAKDAAPTGLRRYLGLDAPRQTANLLTDKAAVERAVAPGMIPAACWPSHGGHPLVLLQQAAVNLARAELSDREGIIAVNGPPGTGKTTLLRDVVAACVLDRAIAMAEFEDPATAFTPSGQKIAFGGGAFYHLYSLAPGLRGHEVLVASSNNKAVENVSRELPSVDAVGRSLDKLSYFRSVSDLVHNPKDGRQGDDDPAQPIETWGLIAAVLGNATNRFHFQQSFWWDEECAFQWYLKVAKGDTAAGQITDHVTGEVRARLVVEKEAPPSPAMAKANWRSAKERFLGLKQEVDNELQALELVRQLCQRLAAQRSQLSESEDKLGRLVSTRDDAEARRTELEWQVKQRQVANDQCSQEVSRHRQVRPGFFPRLFRTRSWREWSREHAPFRRAAKEAARALHTTQQDLIKAANALDMLAVEIGHLEHTVDTLRHQVERMSWEVDEHRHVLGEGIVDAEFFAKGHESSNLAAPWMPVSLHRKREELFVAAMSLHRAFIDASAQKVLHNLGALMDVMSGKRTLDKEQGQLLGDLWSTLFMVIPVLSTTFASVERMLGKLGPGGIGWLLIDEAGQALPQAAVGAIMRARRSVVVGDPLQIPPVVTLPERLNAEISTFFKVDKEMWAAPDASAQTLADRASAFQAEFRCGPGVRCVGIPLLVHRRCQEPMFGISNRIAYDGQMVYADSSRPGNRVGEVLGPSRWFDVTGNADNKWCPCEGDFVVNLLQQLAAAGVKNPDLFIITPFRIVAEGLRGCLKRNRALCSALDININKWTKDRIGTIHTFQGGEAQSVMLILGAPQPAQHGARNWASGTPNIFNVAVSRAKQNLYVIGSHGSWSGVGYAREVATLPVQRLSPHGASPQA